MSITLEPGKRYVTRSGWITPPIKALTHDVFKFGIATNFVVLHSWKADGTAPFGKKEDDLVEELNPALRQTDVSSRLSFEEMVWEKRFPDEDFDADNFYDWAAENGKEAFYVCIDVARDLGL